MQSDCQVKKARFQFLFFFRQRRQKILVRRDPRSEQGCDAEDEWIRAEGLDQASTILSGKHPFTPWLGHYPYLVKLSTLHRRERSEPWSAASLARPMVSKGYRDAHPMLVCALCH
jgi:hypothetical protein